MMSMSPKLERVRPRSEIILNAGMARLSQGVRFDKQDLPAMQRESLFRPTWSASIDNGRRTRRWGLKQFFCYEHARKPRQFDVEVCLISAEFFSEGINACPSWTTKFSPSAFPAYHAADMKYVTRLLAVTKFPSKFRGRSRSNSSAPDLAYRLRK
jgi:hypothetical protein